MYNDIVKILTENSLNKYIKEDLTRQQIRKKAYSIARKMIKAEVKKLELKERTEKLKQQQEKIIKDKIKNAKRYKKIQRELN